MKWGQCLKLFCKDISEACGCLMIIASILLGINSIDTIHTSLLWQIVIIASAYTFYKFAFVNNLELGEKAQSISFAICFTLADTLIVLWLCLFSPGKIADNDLLAIYIIVFLITKGAVYAMMYMDGQKQAKQLNAKLSEYQNNANN